jgi:bla regulator protein blaR1
MRVFTVLERDLHRWLHPGAATAVCLAALFSVYTGRDVQAQRAASQTLAEPQSMPAWQKSAGGKMEFEVASVRPSEPGSSPGANMSMNVGDYLHPTGGLFTGNLPLVTYIAFAYKLPLDHEQGKLLLDSLPKWAATQMFTVHARASSGNPTKDQYRLMVQALLADRFKLASHIEQRNVPVLALTLIKPGTLGPNLRPHGNGPPCKLPASENASVPLPGSRTPPGGDESFPFNCGSFNLVVRPNSIVLTGSRDETIAALAMWLSGLGAADLERPVVDQTGLDGKFDFSLKWGFILPGSSSADAANQPELTGLPFKRALKDQLGLNLKPTTAPMDFFVVDHVELPSSN